MRLEGKIVDDHFLDPADRKGILVMAGWTCCDHWEEGKTWNDEDTQIASASLRDQIHRLRSHPSVFVWLNGSDNHPPADEEQRYVSILKELNWPNPYVSSATLGPYEYVSPIYWLTDHELGGLWFQHRNQSGSGCAAGRESREIPSSRTLVAY